MSSSEASIRILVADDHGIFREGLQLAIGRLAAEGLLLVAEAPHGRAALEVLQHVPVDLVLMDIEMPVMDGIQATARLREEHPEIPVIALSSHNDLPSISEMITAGARGYLLKSVERGELLQAVRTVARGGTYFTPGVAAQLKEWMQHNLANARGEGLSEREREVIVLLCKGFSNKQIGDALRISKRTVDGHRERIMNKIRAHNLADIIAYAIKFGLHRV
ncbi:response regulator transcription factor [Flaviaesturariibacter amylovorans]|uniref:Response regulator transcription factor n=1 Tax=Flaviaesturariibacter amylovorans TaxID=1084520 RepID=A0ABP8GFF4_9BACT